MPSSLFLIRLQSNSLVSLGFMLGVIVLRLSRMATTTTTAAAIAKDEKIVVVKSIPSSTVDFLLSCIEKHCTLRDEMKGIVVSSELDDVIAFIVQELTSLLLSPWR